MFQITEDATNSVKPACVGRLGLASKRPATRILRQRRARLARILIQIFRASQSVRCVTRLPSVETCLAHRYSARRSQLGCVLCIKYVVKHQSINYESSRTILQQHPHSRLILHHSTLKYSPLKCLLPTTLRSLSPRRQASYENVIERAQIELCDAGDGACTPPC